MARIGILTCSNATQDLGCSSVSCLADRWIEYFINPGDRYKILGS